MIRAVLVTLDRSSFAEQALPAAIAIARRAKAELYLLHMRTLTPPLAFQHVDWWSDALLQEEKDYRDKIAQRIRDEAGMEAIIETRGKEAA